MLTVLTIAYPFAEVARDAVGGAEQVAYALDETLVQRGHASVMIAAEGSRIAGELVPVPRPHGPLDAATTHAIHDFVRAATRGLLARRHFDVVHLHGVDFEHVLPPPGPPALVTLHLPASYYRPDALRSARPRTYLNTVSAAQHRSFPPDLGLLGPIPNGVDVDALACTLTRRGHALCLARICPEKGVHHALEAAHRAGVPLLVGGRVFPYPEHERYFAREVAPLLDRRRRFLGQLGFRRKRRLLASARCLLVPSLVPETSSLVAMEALACGTPVVAYPAGHLADIVEHGTTGYLVRDPRQMADAIHACDAIDPAKCRHVARTRFRRAATVDAYLALYASLAGGDPNVGPGPGPGSALGERAT